MERAARTSAERRLVAQEAMALGGRHRDRRHGLHLLEGETGRADEAVLDVEHDLAGDQQVVVERQRVLGEVDRALDRVLDRHDPAVDLAAGDGVEHVGHGDVVDELGRGEVGLGAQRLLGERAERSEEANPPDHPGHGGVTLPGRAPGARARCSGSMAGVDEIDAAARCWTTSIAGRVDRRRRRGPAALAAVRRRRRRARRPPPGAAPGPARSRVRPGQVARAVRPIVAELLANGTGPVLMTRATPTRSRRSRPWPGRACVEAGCLLYRAPDATPPDAVLVVTAGTADSAGGRRVRADLAGLRLRPRPDRRRRRGRPPPPARHTSTRIVAADAIVVVAGMEGALASVVGGIAGAPVVAVPTSVGYGSSLDGVTALLAMTASCASGVTVVGIDNGFGAACAVARLLR